MPPPTDFHWSPAMARCTHGTRGALATPVGLPGPACLWGHNVAIGDRDREEATLTGFRGSRTGGGEEIASRPAPPCKRLSGASHGRLPAKRCVCIIYLIRVRQGTPEGRAHVGVSLQSPCLMWGLARRKSSKLSAAWLDGSLRLP